MKKLNKPLHEMTRLEYEAAYGKPKKNTTATGTNLIKFHPHASAVEIAVNQGKQVSELVLADYPYLTKGVNE